MTQIQTSGLQEALNRLAKGAHEILPQPALAKALPPSLLRLIQNEKFKAVDILLAQLSKACSADAGNIRQSAALILIETGWQLLRERQKEYLKKIIPSLKNIAGSSSCGAQAQSGANELLTKLMDNRTTGQDSAPKPALDPLARKEQEIFQLAGSGNVEEAKNRLYDLVIECARKKDFANAERLRERIYEVDPMALMEIIQSGEIIEQEKSDSISKDDLEIWSGLLNVLTMDEFNDLYHSMEERIFRIDQTIVSQGAKNDELFFINLGSARISYMGGDKELVLKTLNAGEVAGENFFDAAVWTVSLIALQLSKVLVLKRKTLEDIERRRPGIESKLRDYLGDSADIHKMLQQKGMDRRKHERFPMERRIQLKVVDNKNRVLSSFKGEMADISQGGFAFIVRITKKENSRLLLGRNIMAGIPVSDMTNKVLGGTVIGVQCCDLIQSDYSVHVKLLREIDNPTLQTILKE